MQNVRAEKRAVGKIVPERGDSYQNLLLACEGLNSDRLALVAKMAERLLEAQPFDEGRVSYAWKKL